MDSLNKKIINIKNLRKNLEKFSDKKICLMVKANAYGHGLKEIVYGSADLVQAYGVATLEEGITLRTLTKKRIIIFSKVTDYATCKENNLEFFFDNEIELLQAIENDCKKLLHLAINSGMNRYGTKSEIVLKNINKILRENKIKLKSIYTHFSMCENKKVTKSQYEKFLTLMSSITIPTEICLGGSGVYDYEFDYDMLRLGIAAYGCEGERVMEITSFISNIIYVKKGEYVGYGKKYKMKKSDFIGVVPVGYFDGLCRSLANNFYVKINGKNYKSVGNICMDCFFVLLDDSVKLGDEVIVMDDAEYYAKKLKTISYEILTNFSNFRGKIEILQ